MWRSTCKYSRPRLSPGKKVVKSILISKFVRIRSVLLLNKHGLLLDGFEKEYRSMMGKAVPWKALGCSSTYDLMLLQCPKVVEVRQLEGGH